MGTRTTGEAYPECDGSTMPADNISSITGVQFFTVVTAHSVLQWVMSSMKTTSWLIRWALQLQRFDFVIEYQKGNLNMAPDALSRLSTRCGLWKNQQEKMELPISPAVIWEEQQSLQL